MGSEWVLPIFPPGSLDSSIITTTWIGIFIVAFFNLRFGWVLSGLIVPGYLVPLILIKPWAAVIILFESVVTYLIVWMYSELGPNSGRINSLFGRDRFFALVLVSVMVRLFFDGWALPLFGEWLNDQLQIRFDYRNNLQSFGLIIIALLANQYWKTGVRGAIVPVTVTIGLTLLITRYVLMEFTNFRISDIGYLYEDVAASILASPKAYIILITTAFIASRMNLHYGWEYNGILIPALLAMQWFQPMKIFISLFEALVIYALAVALLHSPLLANRNVEGARKLVLFFNVGFAWKMLLGWLIPVFEPGWKSTDFFGFGYLLSTLIAIKVHDKGILARLTRATLQTSVTGVLVATTIGFALVLIPQRTLDTALGVVDLPEARVRRLDGDVRTVLEAEKVHVYSVHAAMPAPSLRETEYFRDALAHLSGFLRSDDAGMLERARRLLALVGYELAWVEDRYLLLRESGSRRGWGSFLLDTRSDGGVILEVPDPLEQDGLADGAILLFRGLDADGLAFPGVSRRRVAGATQDVLRQFNSFFQVFHQQFGSRRALQLRAYTPASRRALWDRGREESATGTPALLFIKSRIPEGLDLPRLSELAGNYAVRWGVPDLPNVQAEVTGDGFAQLFIDQAHIRSLRFRSLLAERLPEAERLENGIAGFLEQRLLLDRDTIAPAGSELYRPATMQELMFADVEVLTPLLRILRESRDGAVREMDSRVAALHQSARTIGMQVRLHVDPLEGQEYLTLQDAAPPASRYLGTYLFRLGPSHPLIVQAPRPRFEANTLEAALDLFRRHSACCLQVAGAHPRANADGSADPIRFGPPANFFNLVSQVSLRESGPGPRLALQVRGYAPGEEAPTAPADMILTPDSGAITPGQLSGLARDLFSALADRGRTVLLAGQPGAEDARFAIGRLPQAEYLAATHDAGFAVLWMSAAARQAFRDGGETETEAQRFAALGIADREVELGDWFQAVPRETGVRLPEPLARLLVDYVRERDVVLLEAMRRQLPGQLLRLRDRESGATLLAVLSDQGSLRALGRLDSRTLPQSTALSLAANQRDPAALAAFLDSGPSWLVFE